MARLTIFRIVIAALTGSLIALGGCGGSDESDPVPTVSIDTSAPRTSEDVAHAMALERGAPGDHEPLRYVLVGENATEALVESLRERGFAGVSVGAR